MEKERVETENTISASNENSAKPSVAYVGFALRFLAFLVDSVVVTLVVLPILFAVYGPQVLLDSDLMHDELSLIIQWGLPALVVLIFWKFKSATPGKIWLDMTIVRDSDGGKPNGRQCVVRYFGYYLNLFALGLGFLWILVDKKKRGWHDLLSGTVVVKTNPKK